MKSLALSLCVVAAVALSGCKEKSQPVVPEATQVPVVQPSPVEPQAVATAEPKTLAAQLAALYPIKDDDGNGMASFKRSWTRVVNDGNANGFTYTLEVCLRERVDFLEYVAVCQSTDEGGHPTPGLIDVHVFDVSEPAVRVVDSRRNITSNGFGQPQTPEWLQIGPSTYAVVIKSGYTSTGETISEQEWIVLRNGKLRTELSLPDYHAYQPGCDDDDPECNAHSQWCVAELVKTKPVDAWGRWPILIHASSQVRNEPETERSMLLNSSANGYNFTSDDAVKLECIDG